MGSKLKGKVYLVGAGPGDPGLLTVRGAWLLRNAEVVVSDGLVNASILGLASPAALKICASKKMESARAKSHVDQTQINQTLVRFARKGKIVVRLKGGDPFIFGRGGEEAGHLKKHRIPFEVVPGITAGIAVPAYAGIPVTDRRYASLAVFVTAHEDPQKLDASVDWKKLAQLQGTIVSFMGVRTLAEVVKLLVAGGAPSKLPVSVIERGTLPTQRLVEGTLADIVAKVHASKIESPAVIVFGEVNRLHKELDWFAQGGLSAKTFLLTRASAQAAAFKETLESHGARVLELPALRILPPASWQAFDQAFTSLAKFHWIIFTSTNAVAAVFGRLADLGKDARALFTLKIAAVGEATAAALKDRGICADLVPPEFTTEGLVRELARQDQITGHHFLLPRTDIAPEYLRHALEKGGGKVTEVASYRTVSGIGPSEKKQLQEWLSREKIDAILFTSGSTVTNFFAAVPKTQWKKIPSRLISIGPMTSRALGALGLKPYREAKEHTMAGLLEVLQHE